MSHGYRYRHRVLFEETNLVGNVYFANYVRWQGHCRERFLVEHAPGVVAALRDGSLALVTVNVHADFLAETFAGDEIDVVMYQSGLVGSRIDMRFDYLRGDVLVARGSQAAACMRRTDRGDVVPTAVPPELLAALARFPASGEGNGARTRFSHV